MIEREEIKKINNWLSFYFIQFDNSPPAIIEGRVHPIQFSNSITRINATGRSFREKRLFLQIMFFLAILILIIYPILDTDYYLVIVLIFGGIMLFDYIYYCSLQAKTSKLLLDLVEEENELFVNFGMRMKFYPSDKRLEMEVVSPSTQAPVLQDVNIDFPDEPFENLHKAFAPMSTLSPSSSSSSHHPVDIESPPTRTETSYEFPVVNTALPTQPLNIQAPKPHSALSSSPSSRVGKSGRRVSINETAYVIGEPRESKGSVHAQSLPSSVESDLRPLEEGNHADNPQV